MRLPRRHFNRAAFDAALAARGLTLEQALELAGIRRALWGVALTTPGPLMRAAIARALGLAVEELFPLEINDAL
jgi:lambda repressor-like predicted transcriptional regulator